MTSTLWLPGKLQWAAAIALSRATVRLMTGSPGMWPERTVETALACDCKLLPRKQERAVPNPVGEAVPRTAGLQRAKHHSRLQQTMRKTRPGVGWAGLDQEKRVAALAALWVAAATSSNSNIERVVPARSLSGQFQTHYMNRPATVAFEICRSIGRNQFIRKDDVNNVDGPSASTVETRIDLTRRPNRPKRSRMSERVIWQAGPSSG